MLIRKKAPARYSVLAPVIRLQRDSDILPQYLHTEGTNVPYFERGVVWRSVIDGSLDRCVLRIEASGTVLEGEVLILVEGDPARATYRVECNADWETRAVHATWQQGTSVREIRLQVDEQRRWWQGGRELAELRGCIDVDLGITPATNTLPIRRLDLGEGRAASVTAAWVLFPELKFEVLPQTYTRLAEDRYRYESDLGRFTAELTVDDQGLVIYYENGWERITTVDPTRGAK